MNLGAVYELRERLETAAIAGVNLISEDFRLKRAVQQMEPLGKASPVFRKIELMAKKLVEPECEDRAGVLLDTLGLVDAVLCTQGSTQTEGEIEDLDTPASDGNIYYPASYSKLAPVLEAFRSTGSGRYAIVENAYETMPEIFEDYRMVYWMVKALGDVYAELADLVANKLEQRGEKVIPLLKQNFDREGKREMARRISVIEKIAGSKENEFYRFAAEAGSKEVREAAIGALRHDMSNLPLLLDLYKAEKGKLKEAVLTSLAYMDGEEAEKFWQTAMKKKPLEASGYLQYSVKDWASDLIADELDRQIEDYVSGIGKDEIKEAQTKEEEEKARAKAREKKAEARKILESLWRRAEGKHSDKICRCYEKIYRIFPKQVPEVLIHSLIQENHPSICRLAEEMYQAHGNDFLESVFLVSLLNNPAEQTYDEFSRWMVPENYVEEEPLKEGKGKMLRGFARYFARIFYDENDGGYWVSREEFQVRGRAKARKIEAGFDLRWYSLLLKYPGRHDRGHRDTYSAYRSFYDEIVAGLYRPDVESLQRPYGEFFYEAMTPLLPTTEGVRMLKRCGWTDYRGILKNCIRKNSYATYVIRQLIQELPLTNEELADELDEAIQENKHRAINGIGLWEKWRDGLRSGISADKL